MMGNSHLMTTALLIRGRGEKGDTKIYDELSLESTSKSKSGLGGGPFQYGVTELKRSLS